MFSASHVRSLPPPPASLLTRCIGGRACARQLSHEVVTLNRVARFVSIYYFVFLLTTMAGLYRWIFQVGNVVRKTLCRDGSRSSRTQVACSYGFVHLCWGSHEKRNGVAMWKTWLNVSVAEAVLLSNKSVLVGVTR